MHVVLVHGWSVFDTSTYGELPERLEAEAQAGNLPPLTLHHIWLSKYISFKDEVQIEDLARGFEAAFQREVAPLLNADERFACITHSTGGPVIRHWWQKFYWDAQLPSPLSHLVMLAPANFGSALAQLGKSKLGRLRSWWNSVEPGQGVLNWLEHASPESWELNRSWIQNSSQHDPAQGDPPVYIFTLTGQTIDRQLYDHVNSYTGESGSDGTVRVAAANINAIYVRLEQNIDNAEVVNLLEAIDRQGRGFDLESYPWETNLAVVERTESCRTACKLIPGASHVGATNGILYSIKRQGPHETISAINRCIGVASRRAYTTLCDEFETENKSVRRKERLETDPGFFRNTYYFHDSHSLVMLRLRDDRGQAITEFDFKLTGRKDRPDGLPPGFFVDRQLNLRDRAALTYYLNHDVLHGLAAVKDANGKVVRDRLPGLDRIGMRAYAYPMTGFAHYYPGILAAEAGEMDKYIRPDQTTLIDIVLRRIVHRGVHLLVPADNREPHDFREQSRGEPI